MIKKLHRRRFVDPDWMVELMKKVNHALFGTYPDWRQPSREIDNYAYLQKTLPYSVRSN